MAIESGTLVKVGGRRVPITTMNRDGRLYHREKLLHPACFLFGTVQAVYEVEHEIRKPVLDEKGPVVDEDGPVTEVVRPAKFVALVQWAGPTKYRTSILPLEALQPQPTHNREARRRHLQRRAKK